MYLKSPLNIYTALCLVYWEQRFVLLSFVRKGLYQDVNTALKTFSYNKNQQDALISQIYFRNLRVSDSFAVHHQESSTVHPAIVICHTGYADCLPKQSA